MKLIYFLDAIKSFITGSYALNPYAYAIFNNYCKTIIYELHLLSCELSKILEQDSSFSMYTLNILKNSFALNLIFYGVILIFIRIKELV